MPGKKEKKKTHNWNTNLKIKNTNNKNNKKERNVWKNVTLILLDLALKKKMPKDMKTKLPPMEFDFSKGWKTISGL